MDRGAEAPTESSGYLTAFSFKCAASACSALSLGLGSLLLFKTPQDFIVPFASYFVFDTIFDVGTDWWFQPKRRVFEWVMVAHHLLGLYSMWATPPTDECTTCWRLISVGEFTSPLLYLSLYQKTVLGVDSAATSLALLTIWPFFRFIAPGFALYLQAKALLAGDVGCGRLQCLVNVGYIAMNYMFFSKLWARYWRVHAKASKKAA